MNLKSNQSFLERTAKIGRFALVGLLVFIVGLPFLFSQLFSCEIIRFSEFGEAYRNVFISPEIHKSDFGKIIDVIRKAEVRIDSFYTSRSSKPIIIICSNPQQYQKYCSSTEGAGCSLGTPWGSTFIVLNSEGINIDVVSHEMSHIELFTRIGWWKITTQVPQWFNEGVALMVDKRFVNNPDRIGRYLDYMDEWQYYTRGGQEILELNDIESMKEFFSGNQQSVTLSYMTAALEVSYWSIFVGNDGLLKLISLMKKGNSFAVSYKKTELLSAVKKPKQLPRNPLRLPDSPQINK